MIILWLAGADHFHRVMTRLEFEEAGLMERVPAGATLEAGRVIVARAGGGLRARLFSWPNHLVKLP